MLKRKKIREKGKIPFSRYFQKFETGDQAAVVREISIPIGYSKRIQGKTGKIVGKQGNAYIIEIRDSKKKKRYFIKPVHLIKIVEKA